MGCQQPAEVSSNPWIAHVTFMSYSNHRATTCQLCLLCQPRERAAGACGHAAVIGDNHCCAVIRGMQQSFQSMHVTCPAVPDHCDHVLQWPSCTQGTCYTLVWSACTSNKRV
jgi:hypothetical protein